MIFNIKIICDNNEFVGLVIYLYGYNLCSCNMMYFIFEF